MFVTSSIFERPIVRMDILLIVLGFICIIAGLVGSLLPVIPGPPLGWLGLLLLHVTDAIPMNWTFLSITLVVALLMSVLDYVIPAAGTKRFGGSKAGAWGTTIGLIVGILTPIPFGILIGPFVGALVGEMVFNKTEGKQAVKAAFGSFLGFLASTFMKFFVSIVFLVLFFSKVFEYRDGLF